MCAHARGVFACDVFVVCARFSWRAHARGVHACARARARYVFLWCVLVACACLWCARGVSGCWRVLVLVVCARARARGLLVVCDRGVCSC